MSSSTNICMLSGVPVRENDKVKLYFLGSNGVYGAPLFKTELFYSWDIFKVLGSLSVNAVCVEHGRFKIDDDIKSQYILTLLRTVLDSPSLSFEDIFDRLNDNDLPIYLNRIKNKDYLRFSVIHEDIYNEMVDENKSFIEKLSKEEFLFYQELIEKQVKNYTRVLDKEEPPILNEKEKKDRLKNYKADIFRFNFGFMNSYNYSLSASDLGINVFSDLMKLFDLKDIEALELLMNDMTMLYIIQECGILLSPSPAISLHYSREMKKKLARISLEKLYKNQNEETGLLEVKYSVDTIQSVSFEDLKKYLIKNKDEETLYKLTSLLSEKGFYELGNVIFSSEEIKRSDVLRRFIEDDDTKINIYLE